MPVLRNLWIDGSRLVEPFVGGASVALGLRPRRALLNDINPHLMNFYSQVKATGLPMTLRCVNERAAYDNHRGRFNNLTARSDTLNTPEAAELFYYLNRTCFNGVCRFNAKGLFNVPFGRHANVQYRSDFYDLQATFSGWQFTCRDFEKLKIKANDFIYSDAPYDVDFTTYSTGGFSWEDQERLASWLARQIVPVVASGMATKRIVKLYRSHGFKIRYISAPRRISCTGSRVAAREILATKNLPLLASTG